MLRDVPGHGLGDAGAQVELGGVAQQALGFADVGLAVAHVASAKIAVHGGLGVVHALGGQGSLQFGKQAVEGGAARDGHVVDLVACSGVLRGGSE